MWNNWILITWMHNCSCSYIVFWPDSLLFTYLSACNYRALVVAYESSNLTWSWTGMKIPLTFFFWQFFHSSFYPNLSVQRMPVKQQASIWVVILRRKIMLGWLQYIFFFNVYHWLKLCSKCELMANLFPLFPYKTRNFKIMNKGQIRNGYKKSYSWITLHP